MSTRPINPHNKWSLEICLLALVYWKSSQTSLQLWFCWLVSLFGPNTRIHYSTAGLSTYNRGHQVIGPSFLFIILDVRPFFFFSAFVSFLIYLLLSPCILLKKWPLQLTPKEEARPSRFGKLTSNATSNAFYRKIWSRSWAQDKRRARLKYQGAYRVTQSSNRGDYRLLCLLTHFLCE